jgi:hypothetical protein
MGRRQKLDSTPCGSNDCLTIMLRSDLIDRDYPWPHCAQNDINTGSFIAPGQNIRSLSGVKTACTVT